MLKNKFIGATIITLILFTSNLLAAESSKKDDPSCETKKIHDLGRLSPKKCKKLSAKFACFEDLEKVCKDAMGNETKKRISMKFTGKCVSSPYDCE